jgi:hypothetical protein
MATEKTLALRAIQPHPRPTVHVANGWRRATKAAARKAGMSRRRTTRIIRKQERLDRGLG